MVALSEINGVHLNGVAVTQIQFDDANAGVYGSDRFNDVDGDGASNSDEFLQLTNFSDDPVDISGYTLYDSQLSSNLSQQGHTTYHTFPEGTVLQPGESVFVVTEFSGNLPDGVTEANGGDPTLPPDGGAFSDGTSILASTHYGNYLPSITLQDDYNDDGTGEYAQFAVTNDGWIAANDSRAADNNYPDGIYGAPPGSTVADRTGLVNMRNDLQSNSADNVTYIRAGDTIHYDPTTENVWTTYGWTDFPGNEPTANAQIDAGGLAFKSVYEFSYDTTGKALSTPSGDEDDFDLDGDGTKEVEQFVELVNPNNAPLDISGYELYVPMTGTNDKVQLAHKFEEGTMLASGDSIRIYSQNVDPVPDDGIVANQIYSDTNGAWGYGSSQGGQYAIADPESGEAVVFATHDAFKGGLPSEYNVVDTISASTEYHSVGVNDQIIYDWESGATGRIYDSASSQNFRPAESAVCFCNGTNIETISGEVPVESLQLGDLIKTIDNGLKPIQWIKGRKVSASELEANINLYPVRINAGALGNGLPMRTLMVSQQHRMLISGKITRRMFDKNEVLVIAKSLVFLEGVEIAYDVNEVEYYHFLFDQHEIVMAEGAYAESLYPGKQALKMMPVAARREIYQIFPELVELDVKDVVTPAREFTTAAKARKLIKRHCKNNSPVIDAGFVH